MRILVKAVAGSHLFGTNTPKSDLDFKGIYLPTADEILLNKFDRTKNIKTNKTNNKNTSEDIDIEYYSLDKYLLMLYQGQTVAWELLFTPEDKIIEKDPLWDEIRHSSFMFLNKNVDAFLGYCKQQTNKYGIRGSRMNTLETVLNELEKLSVTRARWHLRDIRETVETLTKLEHCEMIQDKNGKELFVVCGKKFGWDTELHYVITPLKKYHEEYGERSKLAKDNEGVDWKALSHACRVCMQAISLLDNGRIELPMAEHRIEILKSIKAGQVPFKSVANYIEELLDLVLQAKQDSILPDKPNLEVFEYWQKRIYGQIVNEHFVIETWIELSKDFKQE